MAYFCQQLARHVAAENQSGYVGYMSAWRVADKTRLPGTYDFTLEFAGRLQCGAYPPRVPSENWAVNRRIVTACSRARLSKDFRAAVKER
jgi:hypothetical protein